MAPIKSHTIHGVEENYYSSCPRFKETDWDPLLSELKLHTMTPKWHILPEISQHHKWSQRTLGGARNLQTITFQNPPQSTINICWARWVLAPAVLVSIQIIKVRLFVDQGRCKDTRLFWLEGIFYRGPWLSCSWSSQPVEWLNFLPYKGEWGKRWRGRCGPSWLLR